MEAQLGGSDVQRLLQEQYCNFSAPFSAMEILPGQARFRIRE
jgi:hypothetical protein